MLNDQERIIALLGNIKNWSWDIFPQFKLEKEDADALIAYFRECNDKRFMGALYDDKGSQTEVVGQKSCGC